MYTNAYVCQRVITSTFDSSFGKFRFTTLLFSNCCKNHQILQLHFTFLMLASSYIFNYQGQYKKTQTPCL